MDSQIDHVLELIEKYQRILLGKRRLKILNTELKQEKSNLINLEKKYEKEYQDIIDLKHYSVRYAFNKILKNDTQQLEKEKQDYLVAILAYDESVKLIELIEFEIKNLNKVVFNEELVLETLNSALQLTKLEALHKTSPFLGELKTVTNNMTNLVRLKLEAEEALDAVQILQSTFIDLINCLNKVKETMNWGKFYHEIQEAKAKKKSYIDKAHGYIPVIKKHLYFLKNELTDVQDYQQVFKSSEVFIRGFNIEFYYDLISDWINDENLIETLTTTINTNAIILKLADSLKQLMTNSQVELSVLTAKRNKLLLKIDPNQ